MNIFFIADTHFNHTNIIKYCDRPFETVEEMNNRIIHNWNNAVKDSDVVYFLGDFVLGGKRQIELFAAQLNGNKKIILGNHDTKPQHYLDAGFTFASKRPIVFAEKYILSHRPLKEVSSPFINIHGHIHNKVSDSPNTFNVSVEQINYTPINFKTIQSFAF